MNPALKVVRENLKVKKVNEPIYKPARLSGSRLRMFFKIIFSKKDDNKNK
jgi:hypothetical protein